METSAYKRDNPVAENNGTTDHKDNDLHDTTERNSDTDGKLEKAGSSNAEEDLSMTKEEEKKLLLRIDLWMVPYLSLLYLLSFLDRVNIGQAAVAGLKNDLKIVTGNKYQIAL